MKSLQRGTVLQLKENGFHYTYAGIDGSCAKMLNQKGKICPIRIWDVHELFQHLDGTPVDENWWKR